MPVNDRFRKTRKYDSIMRILASSWENSFDLLRFNFMILRIDLSAFENMRKCLSTRSCDEVSHTKSHSQDLKISMPPKNARLDNPASHFSTVFVLDIQYHTCIKSA